MFIFNFFFTSLLFQSIWYNLIILFFVLTQTIHDDSLVFIQYFHWFIYLFVYFLPNWNYFVQKFDLDLFRINFVRLCKKSEMQIIRYGYWLSISQNSNADDIDGIFSSNFQFIHLILSMTQEKINKRKSF